MEPTPINLDTMTIDELRAFRGDEYQARENAQAQVDNATRNIQNANAVLAQKEAEQAAPKETEPADDTQTTETTTDTGEVA